MIEPKTLEDIQVVGGVATLVGAQLVEDIKLVRQYAEDNNIEKYVAIKVETDGSFKRFALNGDTPILIADDDFGVNQKYVAPVVEPAQEQIEVKEEDPCDDNTECISANGENEKEENAEVVESEPAEQTELADDKDFTIPVKCEILGKEEIDEFKRKIDRLTAQNVEYLETIARLQDELETLKLRTDCVALPVKEIDLQDVIKFLKDNGIKTLSI